MSNELLCDIRYKLKRLPGNLMEDIEEYGESQFKLGAMAGEHDARVAIDKIMSYSEEKTDAIIKLEEEIANLKAENKMMIRDDECAELNSGWLSFADKLPENGELIKVRFIITNKGSIEELCFGCNAVKFQIVLAEHMSLSPLSIGTGLIAVYFLEQVDGNRLFITPKYSNLIYKQIKG